MGLVSPPARPSAGREVVTRRRIRIEQWLESALQEDAQLNPRAYYERVAGTITAMHKRDGAFADPRWNYLAEDVEQLRRCVERRFSGRILDLGCGAGHWIEHYARHAQAITLVDMSPKLIACAYGRASGHFRLPTQALIVDIFDEPDSVPFAGQNTIFVAFLLSHYSLSEVTDLLRYICQTADAETHLCVIDSWYSPARRRRRQQESMRSIVDGGVRYAVRKHYFTKMEWMATVRASGMKIAWQWWGKAFFACGCGMTAQRARDRQDRDEEQPHQRARPAHRGRRVQGAHQLPRRRRDPP